MTSSSRFATISELYNKTIIEFGFRMVSSFIQTLVWFDLGLDKSWYHAQPHPIIVKYKFRVKAIGLQALAVLC